jgi:hypothetical protein
MFSRKENTMLDKRTILDQLEALLSTEQQNGPFLADTPGGGECLIPDGADGVKMLADYISAVFSTVNCFTLVGEHISFQGHPKPKFATGGLSEYKIHLLNGHFPPEESYRYRWLP